MFLLQWLLRAHQWVKLFRVHEARHPPFPTAEGVSGELEWTNLLESWKQFRL